MTSPAADIARSLACVTCWRRKRFIHNLTAEYALDIIQLQIRHGRHECESITTVCSRGKVDNVYGAELYDRQEVESADWVHNKDLDYSPLRWNS
jgi:hypothetical protein